jgi:hypothetical protein
MEKQPSCEYLTDEFGKDSFIAGILMMSFWARCRVEDIIHSSEWIDLFDRRSRADHVLSNAVEHAIIWMLLCSRRAL